MNTQLRKTLGFAAIVALGAFAAVAGAQQQGTPPAPPPLKVANIKDNIYWTQGGAGGNTGIIVGTTGVIVVDTKTTVDSSKAVQAEIAKITPKMVDTAIVTHSDAFCPVSSRRRRPAMPNAAR